jgi:Mg2+/Co2+ transporter CorC
VAGLVLAHLGHVPVPGEKVQENGVTIEVLEANKRTVLKVRLTLTPQDTKAAADHDGAH